jgi:hypothetical protein
MAAIVLDYSLSPAGRTGAAGVDLRTADEAVLRYSCFPGDVVLVVGEADFSARWGWVPVLDFAMSLRTIAGALLDSGTQTFEFTESDAEIIFTRVGAAVEITANYASASSSVPYAELAVAAEGFLARVVRELVGDHPALAENPLIGCLVRSLAITP